MSAIMVLANTFKASCSKVSHRGIKEEGREEREGRREEGREGGKEGRRERGKEGGREGRRE